MRERNERVERELKFRIREPRGAVLSALRDALLPFALKRATPRVVEDIFLDTPSLGLYATGASLRLRLRRSEEGWISCSKFPLPPAPDDHDVTSFPGRRKIRTELSHEDVLRGAKEGLQGSAASATLEWLALRVPRESRTLGPVVLVTQLRERYTIRPDGEVKLGTYGSEIVHLLFDHVSAADIRDVDFESLVRRREFDVPVALRCDTFDSVEVEIEPVCVGDELPERLYETIGKTLQTVDVETIVLDKYRLAVQKLALGEEVPC